MSLSAWVEYPGQPSNLSQGHPKTPDICGGLHRIQCASCRPDRAQLWWRKKVMHPATTSGVSHDTPQHVVRAPTSSQPWVMGYGSGILALPHMRILQPSECNRNDVGLCLLTMQAWQHSPACCITHKGQSTSLSQALHIIASCRVSRVCTSNAALPQVDTPSD